MPGWDCGRGPLILGISPSAQSTGSNDSRGCQNRPGLLARPSAKYQSSEQHVDLHLPDVRPKDRIRLNIMSSMLDFQWRSSKPTPGRSTGPDPKSPSANSDPPNVEKLVASSHRGSDCVALCYTYTLLTLTYTSSKRAGRAKERQALEQALPSPLGSLISFHQALG